MRGLGQGYPCRCPLPATQGRGQDGRRKAGDVRHLHLLLAPNEVVSLHVADLVGHDPGQSVHGVRLGDQTREEADVSPGNGKGVHRGVANHVETVIVRGSHDMRRDPMPDILDEVEHLGLVHPAEIRGGLEGELLADLLFVADAVARGSGAHVGAPGRSQQPNQKTAGGDRAGGSCGLSRDEGMDTLHSVPIIYQIPDFSKFFGKDKGSTAVRQS